MVDPISGHQSWNRRSMKLYPTLMHSTDLQIASALPSFRTGVLLLSSLGLMWLSVLLANRYYPEIGFRMRALMRMLRGTTSFRQEARLNKSICPVCQQGSALYDPVYIAYRGIPHIEGNCNCCGSYIRTQLQ